MGAARVEAEAVEKREAAAAEAAARGGWEGGSARVLSEFTRMRR